MEVEEFISRVKASLQKDPANSDEIIERTGCSHSETGIALGALAARGEIEFSAEGKYYLTGGIPEKPAWPLLYDLVLNAFEQGPGTYEEIWERLPHPELWDFGVGPAIGWLYAEGKVEVQESDNGTPIRWGLIS